MSSTTLPALKSKSILPSIVCFKSVYNNRFLRYRVEEIQSNGLLQFSGVKVTDSLAQFDVIPSVVGDGLVHIKSRYTNKFLVRWSPVEKWISASADEPNEDQNNWGCTLLKPSFVDGDSTRIRLFHIQSGHYTRLWPNTNAPFDSCLHTGSTTIDPNIRDVFTVIDWTSVLKLPKNVAFKGDNNKYLGPFLSNGYEYLQFAYDKPSDPKVAHEVTTSSVGTVTIESKYYGKFWRLGSDDWIVADVDEPLISDASSLFRVNVLDVDVVALMNMKKTWYCSWLSVSPVQESLFHSGAQNVGKCCVLRVKDLGQWAPTRSMITASADKSNEDQTNWACTLFRPSFVDGDTSKIRLVHVQVGHYLNLATQESPFNDCLYIGTEPIDPNSRDIFIVSDYTSLLKLPKNVAFKGENGKYLGPFFANGANYLQFSYDNSSDPKVAHEVTSLPDGTITIKSKHLGKYWTLGANDWIFADAAEPAVSDSSSLFRVNVMDANVVSILNMKKTWYIKRYTQSPDMESLLKAAIQNVDEWSVIRVTDLGP